MSNPKFIGNLLLWPISRSTRNFRVFVVEPKEYRPEQHADIFSAAITALIAPESRPIDPYAAGPSTAIVEPFDLITFPEAFLPQNDLLSALEQLSSIASFGCIHVGLRPTETDERHLFHVGEIDDLVGALLKMPQIDETDLKPFSDWLKQQSPDQMFNIGCLFTIDTQQQLRVCLHPKLVRSKFEVSALHENHMAEANLLTLVTLLPVDKSLLSVTLQPLLCSDALHLETDRPQSWPLEGVSNDANCFGSAPPDHIDIVSVPTCTPQQAQATQQGKQFYSWHQEYLGSFIRAASELSRHHFSTFVLSNFRTVPGPAAGGLSGAFIPVPLSSSTFPSFVAISSWGRSNGSTNRWSTPDDDIAVGKGWSSRGYVVSLDTAVPEASAHMLGFTVHRLPRDGTRWNTRPGFADFQLRSAIDDPNSGGMIFRRQEV